MTTPAWTVMQWPTVRLTVEEFHSCAPRMRQVSASSNRQVSYASHPHGQVLWGTHHRGAPVGLAWEWTEVTRAVIAMSDPMHIVSNALLVDVNGCPLNEQDLILEFNTAVYQLAWYDELLQAQRAEQQLLAA